MTVESVIGKIWMEKAMNMLKNAVRVRRNVKRYAKMAEKFAIFRAFRTFTKRLAVDKRLKAATKSFANISLLFRKRKSMHSVFYTLGTNLNSQKFLKKISSKRTSALKRASLVALHQNAHLSSITAAIQRKTILKFLGIWLKRTKTESLIRTNQHYSAALLLPESERKEKARIMNTSRESRLKAAIVQMWVEMVGGRKGVKRGGKLIDM